MSIHGDGTATVQSRSWSLLLPPASFHTDIQAYIKNPFTISYLITFSPNQCVTGKTSSFVITCSSCLPFGGLRGHWITVRAHGRRRPGPRQDEELGRRLAAQDIKQKAPPLSADCRVNHSPAASIFPPKIWTYSLA